MSFLEEKPPWSKGRIKKLGEAIRTEDEYDKALFNDFMRQQTRLITEIEPIIQEVLSASILTEAEDDEEVSPNSGRYRYSSRVKIYRTLVEKIKRMKTTPMHRIQDISGLRVDLDGSHDVQDEIASKLQEAMESAGATKVKSVDLRSGEHAGYRALHLHVDFPAGKAEIQLRTAFQAQWANLYEVAADIFGRQIRYAQWDLGLNEDQRNFVIGLQNLSESIHEFELSRQVIRGRQHLDNLSGDLAAPVAVNNALANELYGRIEAMLDRLRDLRAT